MASIVLGLCILSTATGVGSYLTAKIPASGPHVIKTLELDLLKNVIVKLNLIQDDFNKRKIELADDDGNVSGFQAIKSIYSEFQSRMDSMCNEIDEIITGDYKTKYDEYAKKHDRIFKPDGFHLFTDFINSYAGGDMKTLQNFKSEQCSKFT